MTLRKSRIFFFGLFTVVVLLAIALVVFNSSEPTYHGRRLSTWLDELAKPQTENESPANALAREAEFTNVVRSVGTKALPAYLDWIKNAPRETSPYEKLAEWFRGVSGNRVNLPEQPDWAAKAVWAIQILGTDAKSAIPRLALLLNSDSSCHAAGRCLVAIGADSVPVLIATLTTTTNERVRDTVAQAIGDLGVTAKPARAGLLEWLQNEQPRVSLGVATADLVLRALVELAPTAEDLPPLLAAQLFATNAAIGAAYGLARTGTPGTVPLLQALTNENTRIRCAAEAAFELREFLRTERARTYPLFAQFDHFNAQFGNRMILANLHPFGEAEHRTIERIASAQTNAADLSVRLTASNVLAFLKVSNQQSALTSKTKVILNKPVLHLDEVQGEDPGYRYMAKSLIENNPDVQKALKSAKPSILVEEISSKDLEWITSEISKIKGFVSAPHGGTAVKYNHYIIAVVGGFIDDKFFNVYFIRIPGHGWIYLDKKEVPAPLVTYGE